jgi:YHS domain-containing protein
MISILTSVFMGIALVPGVGAPATSSSMVKGATSSEVEQRSACACPGCLAVVKDGSSQCLKSGGNGERNYVVSLYDPVGKVQVSLEESNWFSQYGGVQFHFATVENKAAFDTALKKLSKFTR